MLWWTLVAMTSLLFAPMLRAQEADCAEVKIVVEQKLSLERQAFDAHMVIRNGLDGQLTNVKVELFYRTRTSSPWSPPPTQTRSVPPSSSASTR